MLDDGKLQTPLILEQLQELPNLEEVFLYEQDF